MRIFVVCSIELGLNSGPSVVVAEHTQNLAKMGNQVTLFAPKYGYEGNLDGVETVKIACGSSLRLSKLLYQVLLLVVLARRIISDRPDCLVVRHSVVNFGFFVPAQLFKTPFVLLVPAEPVEEMKVDTRYVPRLYLTFFNRLQALLFPRAARIVVPHPALGRMLIRRYGLEARRVTTIGNGVDTDLFKIMSRQRCRERLKLDEWLSYLTFVGNIQPWHGLDYVIHAVPYLRQLRADIQILVVGDGPALPDVIELTEKLGVTHSVRFVGPVPREQVPYWLGASDICLLPAKMIRSHPGDPIKMYEYMACGKPILAADVEGYGDFVEKNGLGMSADFTDAKELATAMHNLLDSDLASYQSHNRAFAVDHYRWEAIVARVNQLLVEACQKNL